MQYNERAVYLEDRYFGRFDSVERLNQVIANELNENWENGDGKLDPWDFSIQERIGEVFEFEG